MKKIFVVDDSDFNLVKAEQALDEIYSVYTFSSAAKMFAIIEKVTPDLILLDVKMPEMDGFEVLKKLNANDNYSKIPVIFLTAAVDEDIEVKGFEMGVVDFITKPFSKPILLSRIENHLEISDLIQKRTEKIERLQSGIVSVLADMIENRDKITGGHVERVAKYTEILVKALIRKQTYVDELESWNLNMMSSSARLHDIGKITISDIILNKPAKLTPEEFEIIKTHPKEGARIIDQIIEITGNDNFLKNAKLFALYHHEYWNGNGYPHQIKELEIPLQGRIMAIVDVYDALTSKRPYKDAFTHEDAVKIIMESSGKQFDPKIVETFNEINSEFKEAKNEVI